MTAPRGRSAAELKRLFDVMREDEPDDPLWKGVNGIATDGHAVVVEFRQATSTLGCSARRDQALRAASVVRARWSAG